MRLFRIDDMEVADVGKWRREEAKRTAGGAIIQHLPHQMRFDGTPEEQCAVSTVDLT